MAPRVSFDRVDVAFDPTPPAIDTNQPYVTDVWPPRVRFDPGHPVDSTNVTVTWC